MSKQGTIIIDSFAAMPKYAIEDAKYFLSLKHDYLSKCRELFLKSGHFYNLLGGLYKYLTGCIVVRKYNNTKVFTV